MENDVILNKISVIERCMNRVKVVYANNPESLKDYTKQDSIILNIQRACESSIDLAMHIVADQRLGLPQSSRDAFDMLKDHSVINEDIARRLKAMVGFRNIAVHDYQNINLDILEQIVVNHLSDFIAYTKQILNFQGTR
ncbi:type VII toxin-antitoxin system HepT family RNase toxin [Peribacillus simplex]|uniref:type VII toxin-antitoxin system HepT family RNase toxin n=1 Tax=Peribacillus simplex TaxID=1478 RepID=UPI0024C19ACD|nr:DUF86 domain-containing protein [Peribacillus simplex]WHY55938.1 DUF86 domain-containing protein [Peribacillus simplex]